MRNMKKKLIELIQLSEHQQIGNLLQVNACWRADNRAKQKLAISKP